MSLVPPLSLDYPRFQSVLPELFWLFSIGAPGCKVNALHCSPLL